AVAVKVGFELRLATYGFALLALLGRGYGPRTARLLALPGRLLPRLGCAGAAIMTEPFLGDRSARRGRGAPGAQRPDESAAAERPRRARAERRRCLAARGDDRL